VQIPERGLNQRNSNRNIGIITFAMKTTSSEKKKHRNCNRDFSIHLIKQKHQSTSYNYKNKLI